MRRAGAGRAVSAGSLAFFLLAWRPLRVALRTLVALTLLLRSRGTKRPVLFVFNGRGRCDGAHGFPVLSFSATWRPGLLRILALPRIAVGRRAAKVKARATHTPENACSLVPNCLKRTWGRARNADSPRGRCRFWCTTSRGHRTSGRGRGSRPDRPRQRGTCAPPSRPRAPGTTRAFRSRDSSS